MARPVKSPERNAEIVKRRLAGEWPTQIAAAMGLTRNAVIGTLNRAGLVDGGVDRSAVMKAFGARGEAIGNSKLTVGAVRDIRRHWVKGSRTLGIRHFAQRYGVSENAVWKVANDLSWRHV